MNRILEQRVSALEGQGGAFHVVYVGGNGGYEYPNETEAQALQRYGISPDSSDTIIFVLYSSDEPGHGELNAKRNQSFEPTT